MPYIKKENRIKFNIQELQKTGLACENAGDLNYVLTIIILSYLNKKGLARYQDYNDVLGVLTAIIQELYRRYIAPYEDKKIVENGDVDE